MSADENQRLSAEERREQILAAASVVFGERGYAGGTTDAIAKQAGVSQAYVVRMFGGKENLFRETAERASLKVQQSFRDTLATFTGEESMDERRQALALSYANLVADRGILLTLLQLFSSGHDDTFAPLARECFLEVYRIVRDEVGMEAQEATEFFAQGMLMMMLLAMRMPDAALDPAAAELMSCSFGEKTSQLIELSLLQSPLDSRARA